MIQEILLSGLPSCRTPTAATTGPPRRIASPGAPSRSGHMGRICALTSSRERSSIPRTGTCFPVLEWLVDNWDPLLHEERLPLSNSGLSAAESLSRTRQPPLSLKDVDDFDWLDTWSAWWARHCIRAGREGGLFPDLYLRRYRDRLELSTGAEPLPGIPDEFTFQTPNRTYRVDLLPAAEALFGVVSNAVSELERRLPQSSRIKRLSARIADLTAPGRVTSRMAWLSGFGDDIEQYRHVAEAVNDTLATVDAEVRESITGAQRATPLVVGGSAYARLLYGAISPGIDLLDVVSLTKLIVDNYVADAHRWLSRLELPLDVGDVAQFTPGEQGAGSASRLAKCSPAAAATGSISTLSCKDWMYLSRKSIFQTIRYEQYRSSDQRKCRIFSATVGLDGARVSR